MPIYNPATRHSLGLDELDSPVFAGIDCDEIYNSDGNLKIMPDAQGDVGLFGDTDVANGTDGRTFSINRRAAEGDTYLNFYINDDQVAHIASNWDISIRSNLANGVIELGAIPTNIVRLIGTVNAIGEPSGTENLPLRHYGYITADAAQRYVTWLLDDTDDWFHLTRSDTNILGLKVEMDLATTGDLTCSTINYTTLNPAVDVSGPIATHAALLTGVHGLDITAGKVLTVQDNVTITGALGTGAYATIANYAPLASPMFTGVVQILGGTALLPSLALTGYPTTGFFFLNEYAFCMTILGTEVHRFTNNAYYNLSNSGYIALGGIGDVILIRDDANILALRNAANVQSLKIYTSYTDTSNYERLGINTAAGTITLAAETLGTGTDNIAIALTPAGTGMVNINGKARFRDDAIYIWSGSDGWLNLVADTGVEMNVPVLNTGSLYVAAGFGCNGALPQTGYANAPWDEPGAGAFGVDSAAHMAVLVELVQDIQAALVANGILATPA